LVSIPAPGGQAFNLAYNVEHFTYLEKEDCYVRPKGNKLSTAGTWHQAKTDKLKMHTTKSCLLCSVKSLCSKAT